MYAVEYRQPASLAEAAGLLASTGGRPLAGGQSLVAAMKLRLSQPGTLVDLGGIAELKGIRRDGDHLVIGAMTRHAEVASSDIVSSAMPALAQLAEGTGATVRTHERAIAADDFFKGMFETALGPDEILTAVDFPVLERAAYAKFPNPASRFALVGVFVSRAANGQVRVAVTGAAPSVFRATALENALSRSFAPAAAKGVAIDASHLNSDLHGSAEYRAHLVAVMASRAVAAMS
jgi:carbon-monoxide dehydrogenase medium subunit